MALGADEAEETLVEVKGLVEEFTDEVAGYYKSYEESLKGINGEFRKMDKVLSLQRRQRKRFDDLFTIIEGLEISTSEMLSESESISMTDAQMEALKQRTLEIEGLKAKMRQCERELSSLGRAKRKTGSILLRLIMGKVSVLIHNEADKLQFKNEYNRFKALMKYPFLLLPLMQFYMGFSLLALEVYSLFLAFYYTVIAVRENILSINGSRIDPWWIYHHYVSLIGCLLYLLAIGNNPEHIIITSQGTQWLNFVMTFQGVVVFIQQEYQSARDYARKAMNKQGRLDVKSSEVIDERPHGLFAILIPALYLVYFLEFITGIYFAWAATRMAQQPDVYPSYSKLQILGVSICWFVVSIGNTLTLIQVLYRKKMVSTNRVTLALDRASRIFRRIVG